jgi:hypothetical protein
MGAVVRIILGVFIVVGAWVGKGRATANAAAKDVSLTLYGTAVTSSSLNLIVLAFSLVGVAMIGLGIVALAKCR